MSKKSILISLVNQFGIKWILSRLIRSLSIKSNLMKLRCPNVSWTHIFSKDIFNHKNYANPSNYKSFKISQNINFLHLTSKTVNYRYYFKLWDTKTTNPIIEAELLRNGRLKLFGHFYLTDKFPPNWHYDFLQKTDFPNDTHWSKISDFGFGDIKCVWEINRFSFVYYLIRSYARTQDDKYPRMFWDAFENWLKLNPPQLGANWKCGQEIALRVITWCFGLFTFLYSPISTDKRIFEMAHTIHLFGERIQANLNYALSQNNNHGISEAAGLWTIGLLFPEFKKSAAWLKTADLLLAQQIKRLLYDDGAFSQLSPNYHRLIMQIFLWVCALDKLNRTAPNPNLLPKLHSAFEWAYQLLELSNGNMPNSSGNDSSLLFPLSNCSPNDYRPTLQALSYLLNGELIFPSGPWDEEALWFFGSDVFKAPRRTIPQTDVTSNRGGFNVIRNKQSWAVLRCGSYTHRPIHADLLHLDIWWRGKYIALDPGTYSYNNSNNWRNDLACTKYHNTVTIDTLDQMQRAGRFLWLPWAKSHSSVIKRSPYKNLAWMEGMHHGFHRLNHNYTHIRCVFNIHDQWWIVLDSIPLHDQQRAIVHWLFAHAPYFWDERNNTLLIDYPAGEYQISLTNVGSTSPPRSLHSGLE